MDKSPKPAGGPVLPVSPEISANPVPPKNLQKFTKQNVNAAPETSMGVPLWWCPSCKMAAGTAYRKGDQCIVCLGLLEIWDGQPLGRMTSAADSAALKEALRWKAGDELLNEWMGMQWPSGLGNEVSEEIRRRVLLYDVIVEYWRKGAGRVAPR